MKRPKISPLLKFLVKILLTTGALYIVFRKIDFNELLNLLRQSHSGHLVIAAVFFIVSKVLSAFRLNRFLKDVKVMISERFNLKLYWLGMYYNLFLPGGIGGDGYKIYYLNKSTGIKAKNIFLAVLLDRITGLLALFCLAVLLGYYLPLEPLYRYLIWIIIPVSILVFYFLLRIWFKSFVNSFMITNIQSFGVQLSQLICAWFILLAIGIQVYSGPYLFVFLISSIVATIPFTIGGVGAREITFILASEIMQLELEPAIGLSFIFFFITALVSLFGMVYSYNLKKTKHS